ncbi:hypothetical protein S140_211 [Shewanella sp. phage 1/40]|uniref:hypothetical protein n=1 Tax=Shewanella sp. phage 1/40 TaxID=1458860 RepID=UPI0004F7CF0C|nr:hypothetical protein S140_211 [Shewanella sp. phage 1/40]AHK11618.1 hypothetical protein S140_211 [Shewanella sp. phage 1/40]
MCSVMLENINYFKVLNMKDLQIKLSVIKWEPNQYQHRSSADSYTLTNKDWDRYDLVIEWYYLSDVDENYTIEDATCFSDPVGFWAYQDNPLLELSNRLKLFINTANKTINHLKDNDNLFGLTLGSLPTCSRDRFADQFLIDWVSSIDPTCLTISNDYITALGQITTLQYKWRKMVELFDSVNVMLDGEVMEQLLKAK